MEHENSGDYFCIGSNYNQFCLRSILPKLFLPFSPFFLFQPSKMMHVKAMNMRHRFHQLLLHGLYAHLIRLHAARALQGLRHWVSFTMHLAKSAFLIDKVNDSLELKSGMSQGGAQPFASPF